MNTRENILNSFFYLNIKNIEAKRKILIFVKKIALALKATL